jgi:hypothetical protein
MSDALEAARLKAEKTYNAAADEPSERIEACLTVIGFGRSGSGTSFRAQ